MVQCPQNGWKQNPNRNEEHKKATAFE